MKQIITTFFALLMAVCLWAQAPQAFNYQAVVRDADGNLLENQAVGIKISLLQGSATGQEIYTETHATTTNQFGQVDLKIGTGTVLTGQFDTISWNSGNYHLQLSIDLSGGANYQIMGTTQMLSVPYALYAEEGSGWEKTSKGIAFKNGNVQIGDYLYDADLSIQGNIFFQDTCFISSNDQIVERNYIDFRLKDSLNYYGYVQGLRVETTLGNNSIVGASNQNRYIQALHAESDIWGNLYGNSYGILGLSYVRPGATIYGNSVSVYGQGANSGHVTGDLIGIYGAAQGGGTVDGKRWAGYFSGNTCVIVGSSGQNPSSLAGLFVENNGVSNTSYVFQTATAGGGKSFSITNAGNVGIGTLNVTYPLTVNGTIRSKKVIVDTGWSDFVFEDDYSLMPLHQLDKFIEKNKHLPEIPSAKEVEANGISLGEMDAKLLQKIEELTLYTIEQQKMIEELVKKNEELGKRVKKIEKRKKI